MSHFLVGSKVVVEAPEHSLYSGLNGKKGVIKAVVEQVAIVIFGKDDEEAIPLEVLKDCFF